MKLRDHLQANILSAQKGAQTLVKSSPLNITPKDYPMTADRADQPCINEDTFPIMAFIRSSNNYFVEVMARLGNISLDTFAINLFFDVLLVSLVLFIIGHVIVAGLKAVCRALGVFSFLQRMFSIIENEFSAARGLLTIIALLCSTLLLNSLLPVFSIKIPFATYVLGSLILLFLSIVLLWPVSLIYNWGTYSSVYIKGESTMKNLLGQVVMDYFYVVSFFLRINLQFLRLVVLSGVFIVYNEFYFEFIYPIYNFDNTQFSPQSWDDYAALGVSYTITAIFRFIYELAHMWVVLIMQANAFAMILFLILQALHTVYLFFRLQTYFKERFKSKD